MYDSTTNKNYNTQTHEGLMEAARALQDHGGHNFSFGDTGEHQRIVEYGKMHGVTDTGNSSISGGIGSLFGF